jgi:hypothetical protein
MSKQDPIAAEVVHLLQFFEYSHLNTHLQSVAEPFKNLAHETAFQSRNYETLAALRKLLEAKDCAIRAVLSGMPQ